MKSLGDNRHFLTFIDDVSQKVWVYFLKSKDQIFDHFKQFHAMVEHETGKKLKQKIEASILLECLMPIAEDTKFDMRRLSFAPHNITV